MATPSHLPAIIEFDLAALEQRLLERVRAELEPEDLGRGWLSVKGAADYLDTSPAAVRQLIRRGHLHAYRPQGGSIRLSRQELDDWVRST